MDKLSLTDNSSTKNNNINSKLDKLASNMEQIIKVTKKYIPNRLINHKRSSSQGSYRDKNDITKESKHGLKLFNRIRSSSTSHKSDASNNFNSFLETQQEREIIFDFDISNRYNYYVAECIFLMPSYCEYVEKNINLFCDKNPSENEEANMWKFKNSPITELMKASIDDNEKYSCEVAVPLFEDTINPLMQGSSKYASPFQDSNFLSVNDPRDDKRGSLASQEVARIMSSTSNDINIPTSKPLILYNDKSNDINSSSIVDKGEMNDDNQLLALCIPSTNSKYGSITLVRSSPLQSQSANSIPYDENMFEVINEVEQEWVVEREDIVGFTEIILPDLPKSRSSKQSLSRKLRDTLSSPLHKMSHQVKSHSLPRHTLTTKPINTLFKSVKKSLTSSSKVIFKKANDNIRNLRHTSSSPNMTKKELKELEKAIVDMSLKLANNEPVSKVHAMVKEELEIAQIESAILNKMINYDEKMINDIGEKTKFKNLVEDDSIIENILGEEYVNKNIESTQDDITFKMIKNNRVDDYNDLKVPIDELQNGLKNIQVNFIDIEENEIRKELKQLANDIEHNKNEIEKTVKLSKMSFLQDRSNHLARMTPLITVVKDKLSNLENSVNERITCSQRTNDIEKTYEGRDIIHNLLFKINNEIQTIYDLCRQRKGYDNNLETIVNVLNNVCAYIDVIRSKLDIIDSLERQQKTYTDMLENKKSKSPDKKMIDEMDCLVNEYQNLGTENITVTCKAIREEEHEQILIILKPINFVDENITCNSDDADQFYEINTFDEQSFVEQETPSIYHNIPRTNSSNDKNNMNSQNLADSKVKENIPLDVPSMYNSCNSASFNDKVNTNSKESKIIDMENNEIDVFFEFNSPHKINTTKTTCIVPINVPTQKIRQDLLDERCSVQMVVEESEYGTDTEVHGRKLWDKSSPTKNIRQNQQKSDSKDLEHDIGKERNRKLEKIISVDCNTDKTLENSDESEFIINEIDVNVNLRKKIHLKKSSSSDSLAPMSFFDNGLIVVKKINVNLFASILSNIIIPNNTLPNTDDLSGYIEELPVDDDDDRVSLPSNVQKLEKAVQCLDETLQEEGSKSTDDDSDSIFSINFAKLNVSIVAKSLNDICYYNVEELPFCELEYSLTLNNQSYNNNNPFNYLDVNFESPENAPFNVLVTENNIVNDDGTSKSILSHTSSIKDSNKSLVISREGSPLSTELTIPTYIIKKGSTASITCELTTNFSRDSDISWFKGKNKISYESGRIDRISHDLLEVLIINNVDESDADIYSLEVMNDIYPVAYLSIEEGMSDSFNKVLPKFISPPQTLFVMEGQKAIITCQTNKEAPNLMWYRDRKPIESNDRISFETDTQNNIYKIIILETNLFDQGTYYACCDDITTSTNLVVEEMITEKEITVSSTDDEENLAEYVVSLNSTATIACELEEDEFIQKFVWKKDGKDIFLGDEDKIEHVINNKKHYLIIHNTEESDSGIYSVDIDGNQFMVANIVVSEFDEENGLRRYSKKKRISTHSLTRKSIIEESDNEESVQE
uniref:DH domain-containing protein n=1 Tax=Strongyloides papillosus TaxID=174720 RepID=A0A0N5C347_STREA